MGRDCLKVGLQIRKLVIVATKLCCRSVYNHPFLVGISLFLLFLYRSSPFLFSVLVSSSPVLVCTAVLLGTLLSFGEPNIPAIEIDEKVSAEIAPLKTGGLESTTVVERDEGFGRYSRYTELRREIVEKITDEEPLLDHTDRISKYEAYDDIACNLVPSDKHLRDIEFGKELIDESKSEPLLDHSDRISKFEAYDDITCNPVPSDQHSREIGFGEELIDESKSECKNLETERMVSSNVQKIEGVEVGLSYDEVCENRFPVEKVQAEPENFDDYKSAKGSIDAQVRDHVEPSLRSWERLDGVLEDWFPPHQKLPADNSVDRKSLEGSVDDRGSLMGLWKQLDEVLENRLSPTQKVRAESIEDYISAEGSLDAQIRNQLESSFRSWEQLDSDHDGDDESDSGSDGAESSSPDASMADIIPMLDELHPLLETEILQMSNISRQNSAASMERSEKSLGSSIHSDDESVQKEDQEAGDVKSDTAADDDEEETQGEKEDPAKSPITWTEYDEKNLMDLGTSELERNQRLESLIVRRRERRALGMMNERNLIDLDGMDLPYQIAPISTRRHNPFDFPHDSYDNLGLPPIPGSAPSILLARRNPFDLPYDSSEEKPDLTGDSFQHEFMELNEREALNQKDALFRRNETFNFGSSVFDFDFGRHREASTRATRFRPYFVPERIDSDGMSYSSLQRQSSELSEWKASSAAESEATSADGDLELVEHDSAQEIEPTFEIEHASVHVEHGSQSSEDMESLLDKENEKELVLNVPEIELGGVEKSPAASETGRFSYIRLGDRENNPEAEISDREFSTGEIYLMKESIQEKRSSSSSSLPEGYNEHVHKSLVNRDQSQFNIVKSVDVPVKHSLETSVSDIPTEHSQEASNFSHATELDNNHRREPVYDLSPLASKNPSSSSISSDEQMETSGVDLHNLSSGQRDLFVSEESKIHKEDGERTALDSTQDAKESGLTLEEVAEGAEHGISENQFSEVNQQFEYEVHLSTDSSENELVNENLSDDKVSALQELVVIHEDDVGVHPEGKLETDEPEYSIPAADEYKCSEECTIAPQERETTLLEDIVSSVQVKLPCPEVELIEETIMGKEEDQLLLAFSSSLKNHENDVDEMLVCTFDEGQTLSYDSVIHERWEGPAEQDPSTPHSELDEVGQVNEVDVTLNMVMVQELQDIIFSAPPQSDESSSQPQKFGEKPVAELADKEHVQVISETVLPFTTAEHTNIPHVLDGSVSDEKIIFEETSNTREMDEGLLSELDVVGDFSVKDMGPNAEVHSNSGMQIAHHDTLLGDDADVENIEPGKEITETNLPGIEESNLDLFAGDIGSCLLVLEVQSVDDIDTAFQKVREGEVKKSVAESIKGELTVETPFPETGLLMQNTERGSCSDLPSFKDDVVFHDDLSASERTEFDLPSVEGHNLAFNRREADSRMSVVDTPLIELSYEEVQKPVVSESFTTELSGEQEESPNPETALLPDDEKEPGTCATELVSLGIETAIDNEESVPGKTESHISLVDGNNLNSSMREVVSGMSVLDAGIEKVSEGQVQKYEVAEFVPAEFEGEGVETPFPETKLLLKDTEPVTHAATEVLSVKDDADVENRESVSNTFESDMDAHSGISVLNKVVFEQGGEDLAEVVETETGTSKIVEALTTANETIVGSVESAKLQMGRDIEEKQEGPADEASITSAVESLQIDRDIKERQESPVVEANIAPFIESRDQMGSVDSMEPQPLQRDGDIKEIPESLVEADMKSTIESENQRRISPYTEVVKVQGLPEDQLTFQQESDGNVPNADDSGVENFDELSGE